MRSIWVCRALTKLAASVTPKGAIQTQVTTAITYTAADAIDTRGNANNIEVVYAYELQTTQRLLSITASRIGAASNSAKKLSKQQLAGKNSKSRRAKSAQANAINVQASTTPLQALTYAYDGVGNVTTLSDSSASAQVSFFRNRAVTPDRGYTYDALYQLTSATGRENYVNNTPKGTDWPGGQFIPTNTSDYQAYTRSYTYDLGGNLTKIGSSNWSGAAPPTRQLVISNTSNRAVSTANNAGATQANIDTYFDLAGQSIYLDANRNQPMYWTALHQLYCTITTYRAPTPSTGTGTGTGTGTSDWSNSDREQYAYDGSGQRVRKYASSMAGNTWNHVDTRYLPGLELRVNTATGENLEVIVLDDGARILNWAGGTGKPGDIPNLQLRYQYADRQKSCQIETDNIGNIITHEEYYPYGGTAVLASRSDSEVKYKYIRYSGKERDATGLYYYGLRYYQPWIGRWLNPDPAGTVDGQNLYRMVHNNPLTLQDQAGLMADSPDPTQGQAQANPPMQRKTRPNPKLGSPAPPEVAEDWAFKKYLKPIDVDGGPGVTLDLSECGTVDPDLWHPMEKRQGESIYRGDGFKIHTTLGTRWKTLGLTVIRTFARGPDPEAHTGQAAAFYSLPTVTIAGTAVAIPYKKYMNGVVPLLRGLNGDKTNLIEVATRLHEFPEETEILARNAMLDLVAARTVDQAGLDRGGKGGGGRNPESRSVPAARRWKNERDKVVVELENRIKEKGLDFDEGQEFLYGYLRSENRIGLIKSLPGLSAPADAGQASSSKLAVSCKRKTGLATASPPSKISRPGGSASQSNVPASNHPQSLSGGSYPSTGGSSSTYAASVFGYMPMPAQLASLPSASSPNQHTSQQQVFDDPWDEFDITFFAPPDIDISQYLPQ